MENGYRLYQNYVQGVRCAYGIPLLSFHEWMVRKAWDYEKSVPGGQISVFFFFKNWSQFLILKCYISLPSPDNSKKPDKNRWIKPQIDMLGICGKRTSGF